jgi:hypothetical protein
MADEGTGKGLPFPIHRISQRRLKELEREVDALATPVALAGLAWLMTDGNARPAEPRRART